jgi:hypothetical protein
MTTTQTVNDNQKRKEPIKVQRFVKSKMQIMNGTFEELQDKYDKFVNHILSYRGSILYREFTMSGQLPTVALFYEVPVEVTDEIIKEGLGIEEQ